jgi:hypothetical protein
MKRKRKDEGISEILGTVLLLGISIALFSVLYLMLQNVLVAEHTPVADFIGYIDEDTVFIEHHGGNSLPNSIAITVTIGSTRHIIDFDNDFDENNNGFWDIGERVYFTSSQIDDSFSVSVSIVDVTSNTLLYGGTLKEGIIADQDEDPVSPEQNTLAVSHWRFDDNNGCMALDSYGDNHGMLRPECISNSPTWVEGKINSALFFDGIDDYVQVDNAANLNPRSAITVSTWIKWAINPTTGGSWASIVSKDGDRQYRLQHNQDNTKFEFAVRTNSGGRWLTSTTKPVENVWYYVVGTYDGETLKIYVNGSLENSLSYSGDILQSSSPLLIGSHSSTGRNFNGIIDEIALYNRTLSASEIQDYYLQTISQESQNDTLIAHWKFNEAEGSIANDSSGNENHGTINDALWKMGVNGTALYFNGIDSNVHVDRAGHPELDPVENITVMAWVKNTDLNDNYMNNIIGRSGGSDGYSYRLYINDGSSHDNIGVSLRTQTGGIQSREWTWAEMNESWFHVAMTFSNENGGTLRLYHNALEVGNWDNIGQNLRYRTAFAGDDLYIGSGYQFTSNYFKGLIDDVRIYDATLKSSDIENIYDQTRTTENQSISIWNFNENTGTTAYDSYGSNDGAIYDATWTVGTNESALYFDGVNDYVEVADHPTLNPQEITLMAWVKHDSTTDHRAIIDKRDSVDDGYNLYISPSGNSWMRINGNTLTGTSAIDDDAWHHVVGTYDGSELKIFVDGIEESSTVIGGETIDTTNPLRIGLARDNSFDFNGIIDDVRIYNYALSNQEIVSIYDSTKPSEDILLSIWRFNENTGTIAYDSAGDNHGTINGATWIQGINGSALSFDGDMDYVSIDDDNSLDLSEEGTIEAWVYITNYQPYAGIIHKGNKKDFSDEAYSLQFWGNGGTVRFALFDENGDYENIDSTFELEVEQWYHLAVTWNGSTLALYIDGEVDNSKENVIGSVRNTNGMLQIGSQLTEKYNNNYGYLEFEGVIDEVKMYHTALSQDEINQSFLSNNQTKSSEEERIAHWEFNEATGPTAADSIGSNDGTISGADWISGKQGSALDFDGSNNDLVTIPYDNSLALGHNFSVSFWIYPTPDTVFWRTILTRSSQFTCSFIGGNKIRVHINGYTNIDSQSTAPRNSWTHVVFTFQDSADGNDIIRLYINGEEDGQAGPTWGTSNTPSNPLYFGGDASSSFFTGRLDEITIYNRALSSEEVSSLYDQYD